MDDKWFKQKQKDAGVTAEDIARAAGRARSGVSHIYSGQQRMNLEWAKAFSEVLKVPLDEVLAKAGALEAGIAQEAVPGFSASDAAPWTGKPRDADAQSQVIKAFGGDKAGIDVWRVQSTALALRGYAPGDLMLVDTHQSELCKAGDVVIAQLYNWQSGSAETVLRQFFSPVLVSASPDPDMAQPHVVDHTNVVIKGKVVASWRATP